MSGGAVSNGRQWWSAEGEFELAEFDKYEFGEKMLGPTVAVIDGLSFAFQLQLFPKGAKYSCGEVRDHIGVGIRLVDGPVDELADFNYAVKVYKADGSLEVKLAPMTKAVTMKKDGRNYTEALPTATDKRAPYVLGEEGSEFIRVRVEFGFPPAAFDALALLPPPSPRHDAAERMARWCGCSSGAVTVVAICGKKFIVYKELLTEASDVFQQMLAWGMKEAVKGRIDIDKSGGAVKEFIGFLISGSISPTAFDRYVLEGGQFLLLDSYKGGVDLRVTDASLFQLLDLAERYLLVDLKCLCERSIVEKMQLKKVTFDFLGLLMEAQTYELRVALNVGLCRLLKAYHELSTEDLARFDSADFAVIRGKYMKLASQALNTIKC